jgi:DNA-binding NtrC family response regulator
MSNRSAGQTARSARGAPVEPLGTNASIAVDVRVVSATHRDLGRWSRPACSGGSLLSLERPHASRCRRCARGKAISPLSLSTSEQVHRSRQRTGRMSPAPGAPLSAFAFPATFASLGHAIEHATSWRLTARLSRVTSPRRSPRSWRAAHPPSAAADSQGPSSEFERRTCGMCSAKRRQRAEAIKILGISRKNLWRMLRRRTMIAKQRQTRRADPSGGAAPLRACTPPVPSRPALNQRPASPPR